MRWHWCGCGLARWEGREKTRVCWVAVCVYRVCDECNAIAFKEKNEVTTLKNYLGSV